MLWIWLFDRLMFSYISSITGYLLYMYAANAYTHIGRYNELIWVMFFWGWINHVGGYLWHLEGLNPKPLLVAPIRWTGAMPLNTPSFRVTPLSFDPSIHHSTPWCVNTQWCSATTSGCRQLHVQQHIRTEAWVFRWHVLPSADLLQRAYRRP